MRHKSAAHMRRGRPGVDRWAVYLGNGRRVVSQFEISRDVTSASRSPPVSGMLGGKQENETEMLWHFDFYLVGQDGKRIGGENSTDASSSLDLAVAQAESMMENITHTFGKANRCLIKSQDGTIVREVIADA